MVPQKMTTPKAHCIVAMRVAYGIRVRHESQNPGNKLGEVEGRNTRTFVGVRDDGV
jgi:hypothetical protein